MFKHILIIDNFGVNNGRRLFSCYSFLQKDYSAREARMMGKFLGAKPNKKHFYKSEDTIKTGNNGFLNVATVKKGPPMRVSVLNKLFMRYITDIMATGSFSHDLVGKGLEVTRVAITRDYHILNVFWLASSSDNEDWLEQKLPSVSNHLRNELSQLYLMGNVPKIVFCRDKRHAKLAKLEALLSTVDVGPGADSDPEEVVESKSCSLPPMPMNVYGLQYDIIVERLMQNLSKSRVSHRQVNKNLDSPDPLDTDVVTIENDREAIRKYLLLQKKLKKKRRRTDDNEAFLDFDVIN